MKITLINTYQGGGGASIACKRLNEALTENGIASQVLTQNHISPAWKSTFRKFAERLFFLPSERNKNIRWNFSPANIGTDIARHSLVHHADILHFHWINHGFISLNGVEKIARLKKPVIWTLHDMWLFTGGCHHSRGCENYLEECGNCPFLKSPAIHDLSNKNWKRKKEIFERLNLTIITPSRWLAQCAAKSSLLKDKRITVIPNPLNTEKFLPKNKIETREKYSFPQDKFILCFIAPAPANEYKGYAYLKAALELLSQNPVWKNKIELLVIGKIRSDVFRSFPFKTYLPGYVDNDVMMCDYYNISDVFVLPSLEENLPNTIMEAMSCGTPSVAFDVGGVSDLINHKDNGYLAKYKSAEDLAEGISWCLDDNERLKQMKKNAREMVLRNYTYSLIAQKHAVLYQEILQKTGE